MERQPNCYYAALIGALTFTACVGNGDYIGRTAEALTSTSISADGDTTIASAFPNMSLNGGPLEVSDGKMALVYVDPDSIRATAGARNMVRATLRLHYVEGVVGTALAAHELQREWMPDTATWNCGADGDLTNLDPDCPSTSWEPDAADPWQRPYAVAPTDVVELVAPMANGDPVEFDVTPDVMRILDGDIGRGWLIRVDSIADYAGFYSRFAGSLGPELVLEMEDDAFVPSACPAPHLDDTRITRVAEVVEHVYSGSCPVQRGTDDRVIVPERASHLRGKVIGPDGLAISGVHVRILDHSDFGWTASRGDGMWDLIVNGGGRMIVEFSKPEYLTVQRSIEILRNDYLVLDDVVLLPQQDGSECLQVSGAAGGFYVGPNESDDRGPRRLSMYFPSSSSMTITDAGGATISNYCACAVEYTVDRTTSATGPRAMPGELPGTSGYTYAADLQLRPYDMMTGACGTTPIIGPTFGGSPVFAYVLDYDASALETFLGFDVGDRVPSGHYDQQAGAWVAEPDGRVVEIVDDGSGACAFDVTGDGVADTDIDDDDAHDVTTAELMTLAGHCGSGLAYSIGDRLWRIPVYHFSDWNWALGFLGGALLPFLADLGNNSTNNACTTGGSIIGCEDQTLGEAVPIAGTPWALHYQSERQRGRRSRYELDIPFHGRVLESGAPCDDNADCTAGEVCGADGQCATEPEEVWVEIQVAGHRYMRGPFEYDEGAGSYHFDEWDGTDAWGRLLQGAVPVMVRLGYFFPADYVEPEEVFGRSFSMPPDSTAVPDVPAGKIGFWTTWRGLIGGWDQGSTPDGKARGQGFGGWSITPQHVYDARAGILYRGDGTQLATSGIAPQITTFAGGGTGGEGDAAELASLPTPATAAMAPDGTVYVVQGGVGTTDNRIRQITPDGVLRSFAGDGTYGDAVDDVAAETAAFRFGQSGPRSGIVVRRNGAVVVVDGRNNVLREIREGRVYRIAGQQRYNAVETCPADTPPGGVSIEEWIGDGDVAVDALIRCPRDVAEGPDGALYISDDGNDRIRRIDAAGRITTFATIADPGGIAVSDRGDVYVIARGSEVWRISPDRSSRRIAGGGSACAGSESDPSGDGDFAWNACLVDALDLAIGPDGSVYIVEQATERVRRIGADGIIETIAGRSDIICETCTPRRLRGDGGAATSAYLFSPRGVLFGHDGAVYVVDYLDNRIRRISPSLPDSVIGESVVAEPDGSLVYVFDQWGRHLATRHGMTGENLLQIEYDGNTGLVEHIATYGGGPEIDIVRSSNGLASSLKNFSHATTILTYSRYVGQLGYLSSIEDPEARTYEMTYFDGTDETGLLKTFAEPDNQTWAFAYDRGRLITDTSPTIAQTLERQDCGLDIAYSCDADVTSGWGVLHSFAGATWNPRTIDVWQLGSGGVRRRVTESTGARTILDIGEVEGALSAPVTRTGTDNESVAITRLAQPADGSVVSIASGADPRIGRDDYARAVRMVRAATTTRPYPINTDVTVLREVPMGAPQDLNTTITVNHTRTTTVDEHIDDTSPSCVEQRTITSPTGLVTTICADAFGRVRLIAAPGFEPIDMQYDATTGGVSVVTQGLRETQVSYAAPGGGTQLWPRTISTMDVPGGSAVQTLTYTRDDAGWIDQIDHNGPMMTSSTLGIDRDPRGRIRWLTLPNAQVHGFEYTDGRAFQTYTPPTVTTTAPGGVLDVSAWDAAERPEDLRIMNGHTVIDSLDYLYEPTYGYLRRIDLLGSRSLVITRNATTTPDSVSVDGRIASLVLDGATTTYAYDGPYLDTETWSGTVTGTVDRDIDAYGELSELTVGGTALSFAHDAEGRLTLAADLTITPTLATTPDEHWERGTSLGAGSSEITSNEVLNRYGELDSLDVDHATAGVLYSYAVTTRDELGRETARDEQMAGETAQSFTFGYDGENRLETVTIGGTTVASYDYDANGNRRSVSYDGAWNVLPDVANVTYDEQDRLIQYGDTSLGDAIQCNYAYDAAGQLATRNCGAGTETYDYDLLGNLLSVDLPSGLTIDYDVDGRGRRIRRRVMSGGTVLEEQRWLYLDGLNPVAELDASNVVQRIFVYGTRANIPDYMIQGSTLYRFIADPRGSLRAVVDPSGTVVQRMQYDAFGNVIDEYLASGFDPVLFGFAGGLYDRETKLIRFGARDYDPVTGRWTAKDPLGFGGAQPNLYSYSHSDPINYVDPDGLFVIAAGVTAAIVWGIVGGVANASAQYYVDSQSGDPVRLASIGNAFVWGFLAGAAGGFSRGAWDWARASDGAHGPRWLFHKHRSDGVHKCDI